MKAIFLSIALLFLLSSLGFGQVQTCLIKYTYDANGNRIQREYICGLDPDPEPDPGPIISAKNSGNKKRISPNVENELKTNVDFMLYPNPSAGLFTIKLTGAIKEGNLLISNQSGQIILQQFITNATSEVNLSDYPLGLYNFVVETQGYRKLRVSIKK